MDIKQLEQYFLDTAYIRTGGSAEELQCAKYIKEQCKKLGGKAALESFPVQVADIEEAKLFVDGKEIICKGYKLAGSGEVEAPLYYMPSNDKGSLSECKGKIVMIDGYLGYWAYQDILENGAVGFITYDGNANYADEDIDDEKVWRALKEAQLDEFVRGLPEGLDTGIGERGIRISGGQRQRIGIARALFEDPEVLVLDEATSALDNDTEAAIMDSINRLHGKKTLVIIAHRLQTIEKCDMVYRIEGGKAARER